MTAFAEYSDVAKRLGRELTPGEVESVTWLLDAASALVVDASGVSANWLAELDPIPPVWKYVSVEVVCRALANPNALSTLSETVGSYNYAARFGPGGESPLLLTKTEQLLVRGAVSPGGSTTASPRDGLAPLDDFDDLEFYGTLDVVDS